MARKLAGVVNPNQGLRIFWNGKFVIYDMILLNCFRIILLRAIYPWTFLGSPCTEPKNLGTCTAQHHSITPTSTKLPAMYRKTDVCQSVWMSNLNLISKQEPSSNSAPTINLRKDMREQQHEENVSTLMYPTFEKLQSHIETGAQFILLQPLLFVWICRMCSNIPHLLLLN